MSKVIATTDIYYGYERVLTKGKEYKLTGRGFFYDMDDNFHMFPKTIGDYGYSIYLDTDYYLHKKKHPRWRAILKADGYKKKKREGKNAIFYYVNKQGRNIRYGWRIGGQTRSRDVVYIMMKYHSDKKPYYLVKE